MSEPNALDTLAEALQGFVNEDEGEAAVILGAVIVYEVTRFDDDGDQRNKISYTIPLAQTSMAAACGLLDAGRDIVKAAAVDSGSYDGPGRWGGSDHE